MLSKLGGLKKREKGWDDHIGGGCGLPIEGGFKPAHYGLFIWRFYTSYLCITRKMYLKLLFITINNGVLKDSAVILINVGGILAWAIVFPGFNFWRHCLTLSLFTGDKIVLSLVFSFAGIVLLIFKTRMVFIGITYNVNCFFIIIKAVFFGFIRVYHHPIFQ